MGLALDEGKTRLTAGEEACLAPWGPERKVLDASLFTGLLRAEGSALAVDMDAGLTDRDCLRSAIRAISSQRQPVSPCKASRRNNNTLEGVGLWEPSTTSALTTFFALHDSSCNAANW
mmetsp:Transcript_77679/g.177888  ORF Transcript_77679/g.177888 Transcript_77679/m.177888 type:complete len:118 (+) Transcript_77679:524-877(+)